MSVEQLVAERAVKAFDIGVLRRLAKMKLLQHNALLLTLFAQPALMNSEPLSVYSRKETIHYL